MTASSAEEAQADSKGRRDEPNSPAQDSYALPISQEQGLGEY